MGDAFLDVLRARDIGLGGVGVSVAHGFEGCDLAATIRVIIKLPGHKAFMVRGVIRHVSTGRCGTPGGAQLRFFGVEFTELDERAKGELSEYVAQMVARGRSR